MLHRMFTYITIAYGCNGNLYEHPMCDVRCMWISYVCEHSICEHPM